MILVFAKISFIKTNNMDLSYDELYEIKTLLKNSLDHDSALLPHEIKTQENALKKVVFKMACITKEELLLRKPVDEIYKTIAHV